MRHLTLEELEASLDLIRQAPGDSGRLEMIVCRPGVDQRAVLSEAALDPRVGLVGDNWNSRGSSLTPDGSAHPGMQLTLMNARVIAALARTRAHWPLAGDQLFVDLDLSAANLPPGTHLQIGTAVVEITAQPHTGCAKFAERFGQAARQFINAPANQDLHLRGVNARVVKSGLVKTGDAIQVIRIETA
jgi:MOSC domain-containing protein YiiM